MGHWRCTCELRLVSDASASKWNARYAYSGDSIPPPAEVLSRFVACLPGTAGDAGRALDLACGRAGNGEWLGARGFEVTAWDASDAVIAALRARPGSRIAHPEVRDVVAMPPPANTFDVIVVARFLERALCPAIVAALRPGGVLFYQTFTHGLTNPAFLLEPGELPALFSELEVCHYHEESPVGTGRAEAMLVGRKGA